MNVTLQFLRLYGLRWSELALSVLGGYWIASLTGKLGSILGSGLSASKISFANIFRETLFPTSWKMTINIPAIVLSFALGYYVREVRSISRTVTMEDRRNGIGIVLRTTPFDYEILYHGHYSWTTFCPDYTPNFQPGEKLTVLRYEDRGSCWEIGDPQVGRWDWFKDSRGKAIQFAELKTGD